ncbi:hypothetical protein PVAP13_3NG167501 [Panicum virgatum]|uniref:F-box domain-containing protein n=1 Tax=Panicum virgatum TaxID=38727 RepID=A0A8T0UGP0_PANVG|nr:hypothetical protein PVAP13_3NG167501 [Panicum virgatum]
MLPSRARAPPHLRCRKPSPPPPTVVAMTPQLLASIVEAVGREGRIAGLPEELLALIFGMLGSSNCKHCSLVCCRWLAIKAASRLRLVLDAQVPLL